MYTHLPVSLFCSNQKNFGFYSHSLILPSFVAHWLQCCTNSRHGHFGLSRCLVSTSAHCCVYCDETGPNRPFGRRRPCVKLDGGRVKVGGESILAARQRARFWARPT